MIVLLYYAVLGSFFLSHFLEIYISRSTNEEYIFVHIESYLLERKTSYLSGSQNVSRNLCIHERDISHSQYSFYYVLFHKSYSWLRFLPSLIYDFTPFIFQSAEKICVPKTNSLFKTFNSAIFLTIVITNSLWYEFPRLYNSIFARNTFLDSWWEIYSGISLPVLSLRNNFRDYEVRHQLISKLVNFSS